MLVKNHRQGSETIHLQIGIILGEKNKGIFPGSQVTSLHDDPWQHAFLEAWRHYHLSKNRRVFNKPDILTERIRYFACHQQKAINQIKCASINDWPIPNIKLQEPYHDDERRYFLWRALCNDYVGWHLGDETRFVY